MILSNLSSLCCFSKSIAAASQEEAEAALKDASSEEEEPEVADKDGEESSEESGFGLQNKGSKKRAKKTPVAPALKRNSKKGPAVTAAVGSSLSEAPTAPSVSGGSSAKSGKPVAPKPEKVLAQAANLKEVLEQINPGNVWHQPSKHKDLDGKIHKALQKASQLGLLEDNAEAKRLKDDLSKMASALGTWVDLVNNLKGFTDPQPHQRVLTYLAENQEASSKCIASQSPDCAKIVLQDIGKILAEVRFSGSFHWSDFSRSRNTRSQCWVVYK